MINPFFQTKKATFSKFQFEIKLHPKRKPTSERRSLFCFRSRGTLPHRKVKNRQSVFLSELFFPCQKILSAIFEILWRAKNTFSWVFEKIWNIAVSRKFRGVSFFYLQRLQYLSLYLFMISDSRWVENVDFNFAQMSIDFFLILAFKIRQKPTIWIDIWSWIFISDNDHPPRFDMSMQIRLMLILINMHYLFKKKLPDAFFQIFE